MRILFAGWPIASEMGVLKVFMVRILFAGWPIASEMGVLEIFHSCFTGLLHRMRMLFAGRPIACEMGVLKVFVVDLLVYCIELEFLFLAGLLQ